MKKDSSLLVILCLSDRVETHGCHVWSVDHKMHTGTGISQESQNVLEEGKPSAMEATECVPGLKTTEGQGVDVVRDTHCGQER